MTSHAEAPEFAELRKAGWTTTQSTPLNDLIGPFWRRGEGEHAEFGLLADSRHANHIGIVHGGVIMTFVDLVLGLSLADTTGNTNSVTIQLSISFIGAGRIGEMLTGRGRTSRVSSSVMFVRGEIMSPTGLVATSEGLWKKMRP